MKEIANIWHKFLANIVEVIFFCVIIAYLVFCTLYQNSVPEYKINGIVSFLFFICLYYILFKNFFKVEEKHPKLFRLLILGVSTIIYLAWNYYAKTQPTSDYEVLINGAKEMVNGNFSNLSFDKSNYFYIYNFQVGFVVYLALIMKVIGTRLLFLKIVELLVMSITNLLVYEIASKVYSKRVGVIASIMYMFLLFNIGGSSIINNQHIGALFVALAIWLFVQKNKWLYILSGLCFGIATILRPSSVILLVACILFSIWKLLLKKFKDWKKIITAVIIISVIGVGTIKAFDYVMVKYEFVPNSAISSNVKYFKFILGIYGGSIFGFQTESAEKTQVYFDLEYMNFNYDQYNEISKNILVGLIKDDTQERIRFISDKMITFCGAEDNQIGYGWDNIKNDNLCKVFQYYGYVQYVLLLILSGICSLIYLKKRDDLKYASKDEYFDIIFKAAFIGFFIIHLFIEIQPRYRYEQYFMLVLISAPCLSIIFDKIEKIWGKFKKEKIMLE